MKELVLKLEGKKVEEKIPPEELVSIELTQEQVDLLKKIMRKTTEDYKLLLPFLRNQILIFAVASFEFYIKDVVKFIYLKNIHILKDKARNIVYDKLLTFKNLDEVREYVIEKECYSIGYMRYEELANYFLRKFQINFSGSRIKKRDMVKIFLMRNLLIHNKGLVNRTFLDKVKNTKYKLGDPIEINEKILKKSMNLLLKQVEYIDSCVVKKF